MNDPMLEMQPIEEDQAAAAEKLARTHGHAMAAMTFALGWESENARHLDCLVANKLNLWRDILPPKMEASLMDKPVGHVAKQNFADGGLLKPRREQDCLVLEYFLCDGGFSNLQTWSLRGLPRPADDKYADRMAQSDPVYAVWGEKAP